MLLKYCASSKFIMASCRLQRVPMWISVALVTGSLTCAHAYAAAQAGQDSQLDPRNSNIFRSLGLVTARSRPARLKRDTLRPLPKLLPSSSRVSRRSNAYPGPSSWAISTASATTPTTFPARMGKSRCVCAVMSRERKGRTPECGQIR